MEKHKEEEFGDFQAERVVLFKSDLRPSGPIYTPLGDMKLGGRNKSEGRVDESRFKSRFKGRFE